MIRVNVTELRKHLPAYLGTVKTGEEVAVTSRGKVIARRVPVADEWCAARQRLEALGKECEIGDVVSPTGEAWEAEHGTP